LAFAISGVAAVVACDAECLIALRGQ